MFPRGTFLSVSVNKIKAVDMPESQFSTNSKIIKRGGNIYVNALSIDDNITNEVWHVLLSPHLSEKASHAARGLERRCS